MNERLHQITGRLGKVGIAGTVIFSLFLAWLVITLAFQPTSAHRYAEIKQVHYWISRIGLFVAAVMLGISVYIGLYRHGDVTPWFRRVTYTIVAFMVLQGCLGGIMWLMGGRPGEEVHLIYGYGVVLSLPFFIFVEVTAKKRPAMGSYIWGFTMLAAIIARAILTGSPA